MGMYLDPDHEAFSQALRNPIYVDKSLLLDYTNQLIGTADCKLCVSRPRRFGKSTDANMLSAYYSCGNDASPLFSALNISSKESYHAHLNRYHVIHLNMQNFLSRTGNVEGMLAYLTALLLREIRVVFPNTDLFDEKNLPSILEDTYVQHDASFVFVIDEWDCIFREYKDDEKGQKKYLDFLRDLLKDKPYVKLAYMTGILPIKKYGTHSALNLFDEISMIDAGPLSDFMGFTETEVKDLCDAYHIDYAEMKHWYDGYHLTEDRFTFSPRSVVMAIRRRKFGSYWTNTETYEALRRYIDMNLQGLKDDIVRLLAGDRITINANQFQNDMTSLHSKDDVLTLLVHLGYLSCTHSENDTIVNVPNREIMESFIDSVENSSWDSISDLLIRSDELLKATWDMDEEKVAHIIEDVHLDTSVLTYNNENALSYVLSIAYIAARNEYTMVRELPAGKGFADIAFIPRGDKPAMLVELKWKLDADTALNQIKSKQYPHALERYQERLLLVGISYDRKNKRHRCRIEWYKKS